MGCAFDMYSQSWNGLSYSLLLFVYCFILPICVIFFSYIGIIYHTRTSRKGLFGDNDSPKKHDIGKDFDRRLRRRQSSHTNQRVSSRIKRTIRWTIFVTRYKNCYKKLNLYNLWYYDKNGRCRIGYVCGI